ncbi:MAG: EamA family transporter [Chloroflexota bacterium]
MPLSVVALITLSACIHVGWNLLLKQSPYRQLSSWLAVVVSGFATLPFAWGQATSDLWLVAGVSAIFQGLYYILLAYGYEHYDLGVLYPIARGVAPLLSAIWSFLWLGDQFQLGGIIAIILITGGTMWIGIRNATIGDTQRIPWLPLIIALVISGYTIVDAYGTRQSDPFTYYSICMSCTAIVMTPYVIWQHRTQRFDWAKLPGELPRATIIGTLSFVSYFIVLYSYTQAPVSYVAASREMSIIIAGLVGWLWLKESFGSSRIVGATFVRIGVGVLVLFG